MKSCSVFIILCLAALIARLAVAEILEDSGCPMRDANPQRNYQSNRHVLCPNVSPGRSQVLNVVWSYPRVDSGLYALQRDSITVDANGNVYAPISDLNTFSTIVKLNGTTGSVFPTSLNYSNTLSTTYLTHVNGNKFYYTSIDTSSAYIGDSTTMTVTAGPIALPITLDNFISFAPYLNTHMVSSTEGTLSTTLTDEAMVYIKVADRTVDSTQFNFVGGSPLPVLIYKDSTNEFPIIASYDESNTDAVTRLTSPTYSFNVTLETLDRAWIEDNLLRMSTKINGGSIVKLYDFEAATGNLLNTRTIDKFNGSTFALDFSSLFAVRNISVARIQNNGVSKVVDLINDRLLFPQSGDMDFHTAPMYSKPNNTMMMNVSPLYKRIDLIGLDWDTLEVTTRGSYPRDISYSDVSVGPPVIGEDCHIYSYLSGRIYAFAPLPIQNIVPILECVNQNGLGYFSYRNLGDINAVIPHSLDRNNLFPLNVAPSIDFDASRRGKYFPLSDRYNIGTSGTFVWQLEDYYLNFVVNSSLLCPTSARVRITLTASASFPANFSESVRVSFTVLTGISQTRVTVVTSNLPKRSTEQSLEVELQVAPDETQTELTPEEAIQKFAEEQLRNFNNQLPSLPDAPTNVTTRDVDGVPLSTSIEGKIPSESPLSNEPITVNEPLAVTPSKTPAKVSSANSVMTLSIAYVTLLPLTFCKMLIRLLL